MTDVKINASFILPGRVLPAEPPLLKKKGKVKKKKEEKEKEKSGIVYTQQTLRLRGNQIVVNLRVPKPATQTLHLSKDAYDYFVSSDNPAGRIKSFEWKRLKPNKRVKMHLQEIAENLGGELESFSVLED